jgi:hypothetical protein
VKRTLRAALLAGVVALGGCLYHFRGGNFPEHIRTLAVDPIVNDTQRLELTGPLQDELIRTLPRSLGVRPAGSADADALVRVRITSYQVSTPNYRPGAGDRPEVLQRQVMIAAQVQIVDQVHREIYWEDLGLRGEGPFLEGENEEVGRTAAIQRLVQRIVDGAQSNW